MPLFRNKTLQCFVFFFAINCFNPTPQPSIGKNPFFFFSFPLLVAPTSGFRYFLSWGGETGGKVGGGKRAENITN